MLCGDYAKGGRQSDNHIYVAMNMYWDSVWFTLPKLPNGLKWHVAANTGVASPDDSWAVGSEPELSDQENILLGNRSVIILVGR
jgi:glycogen operon protein